MKGFRGAVCAVLAYGLIACGGGAIQSPDFTPVLQSIAVQPQSFDIAAGNTQQLSAIGTYSAPPGSAATTRDITQSVTWQSSQPLFASVNGGGLVTGVGAGLSTITASLDGQKGSSLANGTEAVLKKVVVSQPSPVVPDGTATYTVQGIYSDSLTPRNITNATIAWTLSPATLGSFNTTTGQTVAITSTGPTGTGTVTATVTSGASVLSGTSQFVVAQITSITVAPATASQAVGLPQLFAATANYASPDGGSDTLSSPVEAIWTAVTTASSPPILDSECAQSAASRTCKVTGQSVGSVTVTATYMGFSAMATLTVTSPVLVAVQITPDPVTAANRTTPSTLELPLGASQNLYALYYYSDAPDAPLVTPKSAADAVVWSVAPSGIVSLTAAANDSVVGMALAKGLASISVTSGSVSDRLAVTVGDAVLVSLVGLVPSKAYVSVSRSVQFTAVGQFSDGSTADVANTDVTWSVADTGVATIDTNGVATAGTVVDLQGITVTASLNSNPSSTATGTLIVTTDGCQTPLLAADGASTQVPDPVGLCLLCEVTTPEAVIDSSFVNFGTISVPVGVLDGQQSLDVDASAATAPYAVPFAAGSTASFVIARPTGTLVLAEVESQIQISTLLSGSVQESTSSLMPLRVDLLGSELLGGVTQDVALVTIQTSLPYDGLRLTFISGVASALTSVNVIEACGISDPPAVTASGIGSLTSDSSTVSVGNSTALLAYDYASATSLLNPADITWSSSNPSVATINSNGAAAGVAPGTTVITATLKDQSQCATHCTASFALAVIANYCAAPLKAPQVVASVVPSGLCLLCTADNLPNIVDGLDATSANLYVPVGLLNASLAMTVQSTAEASSPEPAGEVGFLISQPANPIAVAELLSQFEIDTLDANGNLLQSSSQVTPLRLDLLGTNLTGGQNGVVHFTATVPYQAMRLTFSSGLASVLSQINVNSACGSVTLP